MGLSGERFSYLVIFTGLCKDYFALLCFRETGNMGGVQYVDVGGEMVFL